MGRIDSWFSNWWSGGYAVVSPVGSVVFYRGGVDTVWNLAFSAYVTRIKWFK